MYIGGVKVGVLILLYLYSQLNVPFWRNSYDCAVRLWVFMIIILVQKGV